MPVDPWASLRAGALVPQQRFHLIPSANLLVTIPEPSDELVAELQAHAKAQIAPYKYPRLIEFVDALPKTATGKLRRSELRAR